MIRRLVFVVGLLPLLVFVLLAWIVTGKETKKLVDIFAEWAGAD